MRPCRRDHTVVRVIVTSQATAPSRPSRILVYGVMVRLIDRTAICNGIRETLRQTLSRDSLLLWHCRSFGRTRRRIRGWLADPGGPAVQRFGHPR